MAALDRSLADRWQGGGWALLHSSQIFPCGKGRQVDRSAAESRSRGRRHRDAARRETGRRTVTFQARWAQAHEWQAAAQALPEPNKPVVSAQVPLSVVGPTVECAVFLW
ncbi:hypothetical protein [Streptomyces sp. NPDC014685]|uniref:hypothetical protein n=1 Tax=Streptomyces sp. NPDC014685 TaxID=3364881 RepID=UPI00370294A9